MRRVVAGALLFYGTMLNSAPELCKKVHEKYIFARCKSKIEDGQAPIYYVERAIRKHQHHLLRRLLKKYSSHIDFNTQVNGAGLIYIATNKKNLYAVQLLLHYKADPNIPGPGGMTALSLCNVLNDTEIMQALIAGGAVIKEY